MPEPIRYRIVCDHPELDRRYIIADIDDDRPVGGTVNIELYQRDSSTTAAPMNRRGSRRSIPLACGACGLNAEMQQTSLPELIDKIGPHRDVLTVERCPVEVMPPVDPDELIDMLTGTADLPPGVVVGDELRHVVGLALLCRIVSKLR